MDAIDAPERFLKVSEVAQLLRISRGAAYNYIASGELPSIRIGSSVRVPRDELEAIIAERRRAGRPEEPVAA